MSNYKINEIVNKVALNSTVTKMDIYSPYIALKAEPGEFIILRVNEYGERIPLTIAGYDREDVVLTGVETRTSSPIRILRTEKYTMLNDPNVYPCAEGAGYAGGIMSAAVDGINVALAILEK